MNSSMTDADFRALTQQVLFKDVDLDGLKDFLNTCSIACFEKEDVLIDAGDEQHYVYMITAGSFRVHLPIDSSNPVAILKRGECIGEMALIDKQPASAIVVANEACRTLVINQEHFWQMLEHNHTIAHNLLLVLTRRLRQGHSVMSRIRELLSEYEYNATIDSLTGLHNRRWLDDMLQRVVHRCQTSNIALSVLMIDIDHFKKFNDQHGHPAGDAALRMVAKTLLNNLRPEDHLARYGGEELFAILPGQDADAALSVAERLRETVSTTDIELRDQKSLPPVTISIGVSVLDEGHQPADLLREADEALYRAKNSGRNRVCQ